MTEKKFGGTIVGWQLHTLSIPVEKAKTIQPTMKTDNVYIMTGTVKEDPTGRWQPGFHMKSSVVLYVNEDEGIIETLNTVYRIEGPQGDETLGGDIGDAVKGIFY